MKLMLLLSSPGCCPCWHQPQSFDPKIVLPLAHLLDLTVLCQLSMSTTFAISMPPTSCEVKGLFMHFVRSTKMTAMLVNVKDASLQPITGVIDCCWLKFCTRLTFISLRLRSVLGSFCSCRFRLTNFRL